MMYNKIIIVSNIYGSIFAIFVIIFIFYSFIYYYHSNKAL